MLFLSIKNMIDKRLKYYDEYDEINTIFEREYAKEMKKVMKNNKTIYDLECERMELKCKYDALRQRKSDIETLINFLMLSIKSGNKEDILRLMQNLMRHYYKVLENLDEVGFGEIL